MCALALSAAIVACAPPPVPVAPVSPPVAAPPSVPVDGPALTAEPPPAPPPTAKPEPVPQASCKKADPFGPIKVTKEQWQARPFKGATKLSQLKTSKDSPLRTCGSSHSYKLIGRLTCDDGSLPLAKLKGGARSARQGNVGPGGLCGNIVDKYSVKCPDRAHDLFVDM
jgi:hypothetical protein